jgi:hypothetical protein
MIRRSSVRAARPQHNVDQRWWRRRWKALLAIVVAAFTAALTSVLANLMNAGVSGTVDTLRQESPSRSTTPAPPISPTAHASPPQTSLDSEPDLVVHVDDSINLRDDYSIIMPKAYEPDTTEQQLMRDLDNDGLVSLHSRLYKKGGYPGELVFGITFEGRSSATTRVTNIRAIVRTRSAPLRGTLFALGPQGAGEVRSAYLDLDSAAPVVHALAEDGKPRGPFFRDNALTVSNREQVPLTIRVVTFRYTVQFVLEVSYLVDGVRKKLILDDDGQPFKVTGYPCKKYHRAYTMSGAGSKYVLVENPDFQATYERCG